MQGQELPFALAIDLLFSILYNILMFKKIAFFVLTFAFFICAAFSQGIVTANEYFAQVSEKYGTIKDYESSANIIIGKREMRGRITYLSPNMMRIDFSEPASQAIVFDGKKLVVYLPENAMLLTQDANSESLATSEGLSLMRRYYSVSYETSQTPVPLEEGSDEEVVRLMLWRRTTSEAFRYIRLSINPNTKMIRRLEAVTPANVAYVFDFLSYEINQGLTEQRFKYDIPSAANTYDNFMFSQ